MGNDTEKTILNIARKHFVQNGFAGARMQEIADEAGINKALVHYYFRSKEKLYNRIVSDIMGEMIPRMAAALSAEGAFWDRCEGVIRAYCAILSEQPDIPFFIMYELSQKREHFIGELKKRAGNFSAPRSFLLQIAEEVETGRIRPIQPVHLLLNMMGMTVFPFIARPIFTTVFSYPDPSYEQMLKERPAVILDFLKNALRPD